MSATPFSQLSALERARALTDSGTLELLPGDGSEVIVARGTIAARAVTLVVTDGQRRGGTVGVAEARHMGQAVGRRGAFVIVWNTGGVRVQEGPAALAATAAVGIALAEIALRAGPVVHVITGPRGCFGAPAVIAAAGSTTVMTADAHWGLTGPNLVEAGATSADAVRAIMSAAARRGAGHVDAVTADTADAIRRAIRRHWAAPRRRVSAPRFVAASLRATAALAAHGAVALGVPTSGPRRRRDFFAYSFRRHWRPLGPSLRAGHVHAAWGELAGGEAMCIIVGPDRPHEGLGVADTHAILQAVQLAVDASSVPPAPIVIFLFCRGHALTLDEERAGLPRALAQCLRGVLVARLRGHPLICVLGGGAYGAAYLTLAAPSHRILALRGTAVAPMAPRVLAAFQRLRGLRAAADTPPDLSRMIPEIRMVESVVRLPRALIEEIAVARQVAAQARPVPRFLS